MAVVWLKGQCPKIAELDDEELKRRMAILKPVVRFGKNGTLSLIKDVNPRNVAFTWSPEQAAPLESAYEVARIETYHGCGYVACFKPTIAEVLAQIPDHMLDIAMWFETLSGDTVACYSEGDGHRTVTILYADIPAVEASLRAWNLRNDHAS